MDTIKSNLRKRTITAVVITAVMVLSVSIMCACDNEAKKKNLRDNKEITIYCFGDSITWGMYDTKELEEKIENGETVASLDDGGQGFEDFNVYISSIYQCHPNYPEIMENSLNKLLSEKYKNLKINVVADGICGDYLTNESYKRIIGNPDIVIMLYSGNNFHFNVPYEGTLENNIKALQEKGCYVYLANYGLYPGAKITEDFAKANEYIDKVSKKMNVTLIDTDKYFDDEVKKGNYMREDLFSLDCIHLSPKGYELLGNLAAEQIFTDFFD